MSKNKYKEPSKFTLKNDRSIHLGNAQNHLRSVVRISRKFNNNNITYRDVGELFTLTDKCSDTLRRYINLRNYMDRDQMVKHINSDLKNSLSYTTFDQEKNWLNRLDINLREEALQSYLDRVSDLLVNNKANSLEPNDSLLELIKDIVRTRTLTILRSFDNDGERKASVIRFLVDAELIRNWEYIELDLSSASLKGAKLSGTQLSRALLSKADLSYADLK